MVERTLRPARTHRGGFWTVFSHRPSGDTGSEGGERSLRGNRFPSTITRGKTISERVVLQTGEVLVASLYLLPVIWVHLVSRFFQILCHHP